jgi:hypothetical protein
VVFAACGLAKKMQSGKRQNATGHQEVSIDNTKIGNMGKET